VLQTSNHTIKTVLLTSDDGVLSVSAWQHHPGFFFDKIFSIEEYGVSFQDVHEFEGIVTVNHQAQTGKLVKQHANLKEIPELKMLRTVKILGCHLGLVLFKTALFMDADTMACTSLLPTFDSIQSSLSNGGVAFVRVPKGEEHSEEVLHDVLEQGGSLNAPEANTGIIFLTFGPQVLTLLEDWFKFMFLQKIELPGHYIFSMDQPAFRASLIASKAKMIKLERSLNCRGRNNRAKSTHGNVAMTCRPAYAEEKIDFSNLKHDFKKTEGCKIIHAHELSTIRSSWPVGRMENFYTKARSEDRANYRSARSVFIHVPKSAGNSIKLGLVPFLARSLNTKSMLLSVNSRAEWASLPKATKISHKVLYGCFAMGVCSPHQKCAHYVILREPYSRMISEYRYCDLIKFEDQTCGGRIGVKSMKKLSLVQWAEEKGDVALEHFLPLKHLDWAFDGKKIIDWHKQNRDTRISPIEMRRKREGAATRADLVLALEFIESGMAVVGLTERFEESVKLIAFALTGQNVDSKDIVDKHTHNLAASSKEIKVSSKDRTKIMQSIKLDTHLYERAVSLFQQQVTVYEQLVGSQTA
jgi:hypothetical protein